MTHVVWEYHLPFSSSLVFYKLFVLRSEYFILLRRKFSIVVAQVWGYYSKLPNEGVRNTCSQLMPIKRTHKISTVNLRHSGHLGAKSNYSGYTECYCSGKRISIIRKFAHRLADDDNYHYERASLPLSLRTRKLEKKIQYCCRDIKETSL